MSVKITDFRHFLMKGNRKHEKMTWYDQCVTKRNYTVFIRCREYSLLLFFDNVKEKK